MHDHHDATLFDGEFAEADLLDLVEGTMETDRAKELVASIRAQNPKLLRTITRMQADRLALSGASDVAPPRNLVAGFLAQHASNTTDIEAVEPTQAMERSLRELDRTRRWRRQAPIRGAIAAGIAGIGVTTIAMMIADAISPDVLSVRSPVVLTMPTLAEPTAAAPERLTTNVAIAEYGVVLEGVNEEDLGHSLTDLLAYSNLTLVENLTYEQGAARLSGGNLQLQAAIQAGDGSVVLMQSEMQPLPLIGEESTAPSYAVRFDLASRGFRYAIVVDRDAAPAMVERISRLARTANLVSAHVTPTNGQFVLDAWHDWQTRNASTRPDRLIVPIACDR